LGDIFILLSVWKGDFVLRLILLPYGLEFHMIVSFILDLAFISARFL